MAAIDRSRTITADPQSVWDVLADFGSISSWADNIDHSCILNHSSDPIGATRRVQIGRNALVETITEVHPLPGQNLMPVVDGGAADHDRPVYIMTRDNMLEGDSGASAVARRLRRTANPPGPLRIRVPAHVGSNFEGLVVCVDGRLWKLVRTFDDPATWTEPGVRHLAANGLGGETYRMSPLDDQWELYDLTEDPVEAHNRWTDPDLHELRQRLRNRLKHARAEAIPERNRPWPYAFRRPG